MPNKVSANESIAIFVIKGFFETFVIQSLVNYQKHEDAQNKCHLSAQLACLNAVFLLLCFTFSYLKSIFISGKSSRIYLSLNIFFSIFMRKDVICIILYKV